LAAHDQQQGSVFRRGWTRRGSLSVRLGLGLLMSAWVAVTCGGGGHAWARVSPLTSIEHQIQKPNFLVLLDTSQSMFQVPGGEDEDFTEAGIDCDEGDDYCRVVGTKGRCFFTSSGKHGTGVMHDFEDCTTDAQCTDVGYCKLHAPWGCNSSADCPNDDVCTGHICATVPNGGLMTCNSSADCPTGEPCTKVPNNFCVKNTTTRATIKMCRLAQTMCLNDSHCTTIAGDTCGPASSRMVIAKRVLSRVVQEFRDTVNFGFMTFQQKNYFPYMEVTGSVSTTTRTTFLGRALLETAPTPCFAEATGPTPTCALNGVTYTLKGATNSRYRMNVGGGVFSSTDFSWGGGAGCGVECKIAGVGTGIYEGSYYTYSYATASATATSATQFADYVGRTRVSGGKTYVYWDPPSDQRHVDNIYRNDQWHPFSSSGTCKAVWDSTRWPFMDTSQALPQANAIDMARKIAALTDKVGMGGLYATGGTPLGPALKGDPSASCDNPQTSVYDYLQEVQIKNGNNGVACRPDAVLVLTDGLPGDNDCSNPDCGLSTPGPACHCTAVLNANAIYKDLGAKVYVVGFSGTPAASAYATTITNNIARGGGTSAYFATREDELYQGITSAIYEAARGSYSTSPLTGGSGEGGVSQVLLDARADFPEWRGHLVTYDVSGATPTVMWDAATYFDGTSDPDFWKKRNVWTSSGNTMVKFEVDSGGNITNAATLRALGLATTDAEAALAARWLLGDPAMKNPAPLGAMINSSPIEVAVSGGPTLIYVGASDGMLHAFHSKAQTVGAASYLGGQEAFAYIPQDMLPVARRLFAQGGQRPAPSQHIFGLANSPKVRKMCTSGCDGTGTPVYKTVLVMPEGFGGNDLFAIDISVPHGPNGILSSPGTPPVKLLWNTDTTLSASDKSDLDGALGKTISLPAFFFGKSSAMDDTRVIFASGYTEASNSSQGLALVTASAATGEMRSMISAAGLGAACAKARIEPTEPTLLADVAVARYFGVSDSDRIAAAYIGDTWGNLFRWVPSVDASNNITSGAGTMSAVESFTCSQPLHLPPTIVQLDRYDATKSPGAIFIAQLTNSPHDPITAAETGSFPASKLIIRKDIANATGVVAADPTFGGTGHIVLSTASTAQICAVYDAATTSCSQAMPAGARPLSSAMGVLKSDFTGFVLISLWYVPDSGGCNKGRTYLTVHSVDADGTVQQTHGEKIGDEPVIGAVFAAGKLYITRSDGPHAITATDLKTVVATVPSGDRFRRTGWTELP
jgi:hypothetical protein